MSNRLKVEFIDNSATQYDSNACEVSYNGGSGKGKLYLGDRFAASYVQLKARNCKTVVNCCQDMHGFAKETDVNYLKIDPDDEDDDHLDESFKFIQAALNSFKTVVVHCETGYSKSAVVVLYFLMVKNGCTLGDSYDELRISRGDLKIPPRLAKLLLKKEKVLRGINSMELNGKVLTRLDKSGLKFNAGKSSAKSKSSNTAVFVGLGVVAFFGVLYAVLVAITGKA
jgi:hypothetical protein